VPLGGATALAAARACGSLMGMHQRSWEAARRQFGDGPGTPALIGVLLLPAPCPLPAWVSGLVAALRLGRLDPDLVAVQGRRAATGPSSAPVPALAGAAPTLVVLRAAPTLTGYDDLLTITSTADPDAGAPTTGAPDLDVPA
jgi:hypothetical protein